MSDKVIIASFGKTRTARTATQYQYNHGQKLQFENVDLPANYEVHFSNSINGTAKTVIGDSTGVVIPYEYFVPGQTIYAWVYITDEDSGITIRKVEIPIAMKAKPTDQPLDPEDESLVEQVLNRLNDTIDEIPGAIDAALEEAKESGEFDGPKGDPFTYEDFTPEQLEALTGPKGDPFTYEDFTPEQLEALTGPKGDPFTYEDFTPEQLEALTGPQGPEGSTIWTTNTPYSYSQETGWYYFAASTLRGPTGATQKAGDLVYLSDDTNKEYKAFYIVEFQYGGLQVGCRFLANMQGPPGEGVTGAVLYSQAQALSENEKNRARQNIGAASIADIGVVFRLKGSVQTTANLPLTGNHVGDVYFVISESVGYVWLEHNVPGHSAGGYWEKLGESINIDNLPNTIYWFAGTVDADDHFTPGEYLNNQMLLMAMNMNRLPIIAVSFPDGIIIKLPLLHYSFTNSANDYFVFYTVTSNPSKARLQPVKPLSEFYRISYYKELTVGETPTWRIKYDHGYFVEPETIGDLSNLNTTDKSSIVNAINELAGSGSSDVAVFDFIISLENDEYVITRHPEYDDVYSAFENGKIVIAKIRYANGYVWTDYRFIGALEEAHDSIGGSTIYFSGETGPGNYFVIRGEKSGSAINDWEVIIDDSIWSAVGELESEKLSVTGDAYRALSIPMGQLNNTSTATVMTATVPGITELRDGVCVWLRNGVIASASGVTLNINSLGAKPIYNSLSGAVVTTTFTVASTYLFVYNASRVTGGCWDMVYGYDANTTYTPAKLGFGYATCSTAEATAAKTAALSSYTLTTGGIVAVKFTNAVPAGATLNINSKGAKAIYYHGAAITAGVIKAGDTVTMIYSTYYHIISIDRDEAPVTSVNGQTGAVTVPEPFFVTYSTSDMTTWTCDKTFAQITAAIAAGKQVVMLLSVAGTPFGQASSFLNFPTEIQVWVRLGPNTRYQISHSDDNTVSVDEFTENAAWIEAVADNQGVSHAGEFLVVGSNGYVTTMTLSTWQGGNY